MWPRRSGYAPFSQSALDAARRRTQDLYNARRSQLGPQTRPPPTNPPFLPPSPRPAGRHAIWSGTSGRPQSGSYVIGPRRLDEADPSYYRAQGAQGDDGESSVYFPEENQNPKTAKTHTIVVEAAVEPHQPQSPDGPAGTTGTVLLSQPAGSCYVLSSDVASMEQMEKLPPPRNANRGVVRILV